MSKTAASKSGAALCFPKLSFMLTLFPKRARRLTIRVDGARGLSQIQREILAWLWFLEATGDLGHGAALKWRPRKDYGFPAGLDMPGMSAAWSRSLVRLEQRDLVKRDAPRGRTVAVWLTPTRRASGELLLPQFRESFRRRLDRLGW